MANILEYFRDSSPILAYSFRCAANPTLDRTFTDPSLGRYRRQELRYWRQGGSYAVFCVHRFTKHQYTLMLGFITLIIGTLLIAACAVNQRSLKVSEGERQQADMTCLQLLLHFVSLVFLLIFSCFHCAYDYLYPTLFL